MTVGTGRTEPGQPGNGSKRKCGEVLRHGSMTRANPGTNLSILALRSGLVSARSLAGPVQELLPEQNRLFALRNTAEQGPARTTLPLPGDTALSK